MSPDTRGGDEQVEPARHSVVGRAPAIGSDAPPPASSPPPAGWYADPWGGSAARWWNGDSWEHVNSGGAELAAQRNAREPWARFRPLWIATAIGAVFVAQPWMLAILKHPLTLPLASISALILLAAVWWMDRLEPEPIDALVLCVAWGATVAVALAGEGNSAFSESFGTTTAITFGAPFIEEALKGLLLLELVRRRLIDSMIDGAVYAVAIAVGFALTENLSYYSRAAAAGTETLLQIFLIRGLLTPFAHPLFTICMGVAAGYLVIRRPSHAGTVMIATGSYLLAVALHALWNGSLVAADGALDELWLVGLLFVVLFVGTIILVVALRRSQREQFEQQVPALAELLSMPPAEVTVFAETRNYLQFRRSLPRYCRANLGSLRWTLHAIATLRSVVPRNSEEMRRDCDELGHLRQDATYLRRKLFPETRRGQHGD